VPIYEFICQSCGNEFEHIQSFSDSSVPACVKCHSTNVVRRMGRPAIHFKGSGWYITDSKKSNDNKSGTKSANGDSGESKSESTVESKAESKSESATESKTESKSDAGKKSESSETAKSTPAPVASD
jgi:putative FmdB family regulatory protein